MNIFKAILIFILILVTLTALSFGGEAMGIWRMGIFEPMREDVKREVFENTRSFNEAAKQELTRYRLQYLKADDDNDKNAIASTVRIRFAGFPNTDQLQSELYSFLQECNNR